jgi:hypothetical protein
MNLDIQTAVLTATILIIAAVLIALLVGINSIRSGRKLLYFRKRRQLILQGWRLLLIAVILGGVGLIINRFAAPLAYHYFPPSPTITITPTITETPTITITPSITTTPTITNTPSITDTPSMPIAIEAKFKSTITPNPTVIFSKLIFSTKLDKNFQPVDPNNTFNNPIPKMYGVFSYDQMTVGAQWSALWYRGTDLICYETLPWNGGTGGFGYTECGAPVGGWMPGTYEVRIFIGTIWKQAGTFSVKGIPPTPTITTSPTRTITSTITKGPSPTASPSLTPSPSLTLTSSLTVTASLTLTPSLTPTITLTPSVTNTRRPTDTRMPTPTNTSTPK